MILTTEQADAIRAAGGWVNPHDPRQYMDPPLLATIGGIQLFQVIGGGYLVSSRRGDEWFNTLDQAVSTLLDRWGYAADHEGCPCPPKQPPCTNVIPFPRRTALGAVESWLDGHADAAGQVVSKAVERLADLARRADDILKERRNG